MFVAQSTVRLPSGLAFPMKGSLNLSWDPNIPLHVTEKAFHKKSRNSIRMVVHSYTTFAVCRQQKAEGVAVQQQWAAEFSKQFDAWDWTKQLQ